MWDLGLLRSTFCSRMLVSGGEYARNAMIFGTAVPNFLTASVGAR